MIALFPGRSFESVFNASGLPGLVAQYGDWFSYDRSPRAQIFWRNQSLVHNLDSMIRLMRCVGDSEPGVTWHALCCSLSLIQTFSTPRQAGVRPPASPYMRDPDLPLCERPGLALGTEQAPPSSGPPCPPGRNPPSTLLRMCNWDCPSPEMLVGQEGVLLGELG